MNGNPLLEFARRTGEARRIRYADVRRLQRTILPRGLTSREEAELLIRLDSAVDSADRAWPGFLATVRDYVLSEAAGGHKARIPWYFLPVLELRPVLAACR